MDACMCVCTLSHSSRVQLFATLWTVAHQVPLSMGFFMQEYWVDCHDLLQGIFATHEPMSLKSPAWAGRFFTTNTTWEAQLFG